MRLGFCMLLVCLLVGVQGDIYMQHPRGSNNKLNEASNGRNNGNRLFDSQNNGNGGYQVGDNCDPVCSNTNTYDNTLLGAGQGKMYYYVGSVLQIEWTAQHGCGKNGKVSCEFVIQYMCDGGKDEYGNNHIRDGSTTNTIPNTPASGEIEDPTYGRHESYEYYQICTKRERNKGLFLADQFTEQQAQQRTTAIFTRQDNGGTRYGFECPEERDYYPYWHPTPWKDVAVFTDDTSRCEFYKSESQNVAPKGSCSNPQFNHRQSCTGTWTEVSHNIDPPLCIQNEYTRDNHLGNSRNTEMYNFNWTIPNEPSDSCVIRLRYNISTNDFAGWGKNRVTSEDNYAKSPVKDEPVDDWLGLGGDVSGPLRLSINSDEFSRTFQDRSHTFRIAQRPSNIPASAKIYNLNVRGRRGNIVQTFPAVEYDFVPNQLIVTEGDYIHFQWAGSDANQNNNAGEGRAMTDRSNLVQISDPNTNYPLKYSTKGEFRSMFGDDKDLAAKFAYLGQKGCDPEENGDNPITNCKLLNAAPAYFDAGLVKMTVAGTFHYMSTRNHQFSNRSQKGSLVVQPLIPDFAIALLVVGAVGLSVAAGAFALTKTTAYIAANPTSKLATSCCGVLLAKKSNKVNPEQEDKVQKPPGKFAEFWDRHKFRVIFLTAYALCNVGIYFYGFLRNLNLGPSPYFPMAKGGGAMLNFNCSLILFPVLRNMISWLRLTPLSEVIPLDDNITFHKIIAGAIALASVVHIIGHFLNYASVQTATGVPIPQLAFGTFAGLTGFLLLLCMVVIFITAATPLKRKSFKLGKKKIGGYDIFWTAHHFYIACLILLWLHGPVFWMWSFYPILLFIIEKFIRKFRSQETTQLVKVIKLSSDVISIQMRKRDFRYKAGQYVYLNCPEISKSEWHPFTITSAPEENYFSVHIRCRGDWTSALRSYLNPNNQDVVEFDQKLLVAAPQKPAGANDGASVVDVPNQLVIMTDGPYGSASEHVFDYEVVMLVGAGIGVTPFASIMRSMSLRQQQSQAGQAPSGGGNSQLRPKKVYFYWVCGDEQEFNWFKFLMEDIENDPILKDLVSLNTFLTGEVNIQEVVNKVQKGQAKNINMKYAGRPNWRRIFKENQKAHPSEEVGVFLCGPVVLARELSTMCAANSTVNGTRFVFRKENF